MDFRAALGILRPMFFRPLYIPLVLALAASALAVDLACSSTAPTTYNQAALPIRPPPPPRAPVFNPAEDAPHTFEPGRPSPVQPGPRPTRVLPQDEHTRRQPGVWASEPPPVDLKRPALFDIQLPLPANVPESDAPVPAGLCADLLMEAAGRMPKEKSIMEAMPQDRRACAVANMYAFCISSMFKAMRDAKEQGSAYDAARYSAVERSVVVALLFMKDKCRGDILTGSDNFAWTGIVNNFTQHWRTLIYE